MDQPANVIIMVEGVLILISLVNNKVAQLWLADKRSVCLQLSSVFYVKGSSS